MIARQDHALRLKRAEAREKWALFGLVLPALLTVALVVLLPVSWLFYLSFLGEDGSFSLENYHRVIAQTSYHRVFVTTLQVSIATTLICMVLGYPLAYFLAQLPPGRAGFFLFVLLLPCLTSLLVRTYAWLVLLQNTGLINSVAIQAGLWETPVQLVYNFTGTLIGMVHIMLPFFVLPLYSAMTGIDRTLMAAAASLGAHPVAAFWRVFFPLSVPGVVAGALIVFVLSLGFYVTPAVLGGGRVIMIANLMTAILENRLDWGAASALGVVLLLVTVVCIVLVGRAFRTSATLFGRP